MQTGIALRDQARNMTASIEEARATAATILGAPVSDAEALRLHASFEAARQTGGRPHLEACDQVEEMAVELAAGLVA